VLREHITHMIDIERIETVIDIVRIISKPGHQTLDMAMRRLKARLEETYQKREGGRGEGREG